MVSKARGLCCDFEPLVYKEQHSEWSLTQTYFFYDRDTAIYTYLIMVEKELSASTFIVLELNYIQVNALTEAELCTLKMQQIILHVLLFTV